MTVYLVGAGPGDPGLLTVRGRDLLAVADVVLYDGLVDRRILGLASPAATRIDVAKRGRGGARGRVSQADINALLVDHGRVGGCVVRLKGGDPFVYGRGGEEAEALARARIAFEIVPGVSSAVAVPAYAGIPVTHRGVAASVAIVTGHEAPDKDADAATVDWQHLATAADTLVILMGVSRLAALVESLIAGGRDPATPAAAVENGTTRAQRTLTGTLSDLPAQAAAAKLRSPAVIVVGEVVRLRDRLAWFVETPAATVHEPPAPPQRRRRAGSAAPQRSGRTEIRACA